MQTNGVGRKFFQNPSMESMESQPPLLQPTDSLSSIRPPLVWLFNHIRQEGKSSLYKEDLQKLVGPQVEPSQLDLAFENLDADGDGEVSQEEFIAGFARFWKETPDTPGIEKKYDFSFSPSRFMSGHRHRLPSEEHYEYDGDEMGAEEEDVEPNEQFQRTLNVLSSHNRSVPLHNMHTSVLDRSQTSSKYVCNHATRFAISLPCQSRYVMII